MEISDENEICDKSILMVPMYVGTKSPQYFHFKGELFFPLLSYNVAVELRSSPSLKVGMGDLSPIPTF